MASYLAGVEHLSLEAVSRSVGQFLAGAVEGRNNAFVPSGPELAANAADWQDAIDKVAAGRARRLADSERPLLSIPIGHPMPEGYSSIGPISADYGFGKIDMRAMRSDEKERVRRDDGLQRLLANKANPEKLLRSIADAPKLGKSTPIPALRKL